MFVFEEKRKIVSSRTLPLRNIDEDDDVDESTGKTGKSSLLRGDGTDDSTGMTDDRKDGKDFFFAARRRRRVV